MTIYNEEIDKLLLEACSDTVTHDEIFHVDRVMGFNMHTANGFPYIFLLLLP